MVPRIQALPGVQEVTVDPLTGLSQRGPASADLVGTITVSFNPHVLTIERIADAAGEAQELGRL